MAVSIKVDLSRELAQEPAQLQKRVALLFRDHLLALDKERANKLSPNRSHFYSDASRAVSSQGKESEAIVTIAQQGIRQRLEGGEIKPRAGGKYLTIPARAEAYGRR